MTDSTDARMSDLIDETIGIEWGMMQRLHNVGGPSVCQRNPEKFRAMRESQFVTWSDELLVSYRADLEQAMSDGRNLLFEKYAFMMETTFPSEFVELERFLPYVSNDTMEMIDRIVSANVAWRRDVESRFPNITHMGRVMDSSSDSSKGVSFETYLRCELKTYSPETLLLYDEHVTRCVSSGRNLGEENMAHMMRFYGYSSLEEAESATLQSVGIAAGLKG